MQLISVSHYGPLFFSSVCLLWEMVTAAACSVTAALIVPWSCFQWGEPELIPVWTLKHFSLGPAQRKTLWTGNVLIGRAQEGVRWGCWCPVHPVSRQHMTATRRCVQVPHPSCLWILLVLSMGEAPDNWKQLIPPPPERVTGFSRSDQD